MIGDMLSVSKETELGNKISEIVDFSFWTILEFIGLVVDCEPLIASSKYIGKFVCC